jgi:perosamine synthetase
MVKKIKLFDPVVDTEESNGIIKVLKSGFWASGAGSGIVKNFEEKFQDYVKCKSCVAVNSGTAALHLALSELNIKGKEVLLPSLSFVSTAHSVVYNGGIPVFVDVNPENLCIDSNDVKKKISKKTKVILPVHFAGIPANLKKLQEIADDSNLIMVEDAAHACGSTYGKKMIGSISDMVCFSFHPVKNLAMPTGGLIAINSKKHKKIKDILNSKRWCGISNRKDSDYDVNELGWNFYMNEFSAQIGISQLKKLDRLNKIRKKIARRYYEEIKVEHKMPFEKNSSYHFYWILVKNRSKLRKELAKKGIETGIHYKPIHKMSMYNNNSQLPNTEKISEQIVSIPTHPNLLENDVEKIISLINKLTK